MWKHLVVFMDYRYSGAKYMQGPWDLVIHDLETGVTRRITQESGGKLMRSFHSGWVYYTLPGSGHLKNTLYLMNLYRMGILDEDDHVIPE